MRTALLLALTTALAPACASTTIIPRDNRFVHGTIRNDQAVLHRCGETTTIGPFLSALPGVFPSESNEARDFAERAKRAQTASVITGLVSTAALVAGSVMFSSDFNDTVQEVPNGRFIDAEIGATGGIGLGLVGASIAGFVIAGSSGNVARARALDAVNAHNNRVVDLTDTAACPAQ